jgi:hypothetical protein
MLQNLKTNLHSKLQAMTLAVRKALSHKPAQANAESQANTEDQASERKFALPKTLALSGTSRALLISAAVLGGIGYAVYKSPPFQAIEPGDIGIRMNQMTGTTTEWRDGSVLVLPMVPYLQGGGDE